MGDLLRSVGQVISNAFESVIHGLEDLFHGAFGSVSGTLGLPLLFIGGFIVLGVVAWALAKR